jgi:hypothetical protein
MASTKATTSLLATVADASRRFGQCGTGWSGTVDFLALLRADATVVLTINRLQGEPGKLP